MSSQICLKWNSFLNNIATSFESLWEEEGLVDVTLASDGQCLTAHKVILSASSPFFKKVFQTNPCQHPVIILQDVHFSELEALLIFIYKGEVNIEQKNLPALLKAAETLQIRGLSGGDIFAKESYKRLIELEQTIGEEEECVPEVDEAPKKKQKVNKVQNNSILEKALTPRASRNVSVSESSCSDRCSKDADGTHDDKDTVPNPVYHRLEMKIEPFEVTVEDLQKHTEEKDELQRLDTGQTDGTQVDRTIAGSSKATVTVIAEARDICSPRREEIESRASIDERLELPDHVDREMIRRSENMLEADNNEVETPDNYSESLNFPSDVNPGISHSVFPPFVSNRGNSEISEESQANNTITAKGGTAYPPFPCPFCDRAYTSWGFRRRHIKAVHTISPRLNCKWCLQRIQRLRRVYRYIFSQKGGSEKILNTSQWDKNLKKINNIEEVLPTHAAWRRHVISAHNLSASDAHNGLLILEEAHMVLQIAHPTRLDTLVNIIKQSSQQSNNIRDADSQPD